MRYALIVLTLLAALLASGCYSWNRRHNVKHTRALRGQMGDIHEGVDRYILE